MQKIVFLKGVSYSYLRQLVTLIVGVISLPLLLNYMGSNVYGIWVLILSLTAYLSNVSFGIPSVMVTLVAKEPDPKQKYVILEKSFRVLVAITVMVLVIFILTISYSADWIILLLGNVEGDLIDITKRIFILLVIVSLIKLPLNLYMQFFRGMNMVYISEVYTLFTVLSDFIAILVAVYFQLDIFMFVALMLLGQLSLNIIVVVHVLIKFSYLRSEESCGREITKKRVLKIGFYFFQMGVLASVVGATDNLIINHYLSPEYVASYSIAFKIFLYFTMFTIIINGVLGPSYGNAYAEGDWGAIQKTLSLTIKLLPVFSGLVWFFLLFYAKDIIEIWLGNSDIFGGYLLIFSLGLYSYILAYATSYATLIYSFNIAHKALKIFWLEALLNLVLSLLLIQYLGIAGVALATALAAFFSVFIFLPTIINKSIEYKLLFPYDYSIKHFFSLVVPSVGASVASIFIDDIYTKHLLFTLVFFVYLFGTWKMLAKENRVFIRDYLGFTAK